MLAERKRFKKRRSARVINTGKNSSVSKHVHLHGKHKKIIAIANNYQFHCYLRLFKRTMVNQKDFNLIGNNWWHISLQIRKALFSLAELGRFNAAQNKHAFFSSGAFVYTVSPTKLKINQFSCFWSFKFFYFLFLAGPADNFFALRGESNIDFRTNCVTVTLRD